MYSVPRDKHDIEAIAGLAAAPAQDVVPLLPALLTWVQDMNWPVAEPTAELLLQFPNEITPLVQDVLRGDDVDWQYWCCERLIPQLPFYLKIVLYEDVERIAALDDPLLADYAQAAARALTTFLPE